jgi:hypothetical protein
MKYIVVKADINDGDYLDSSSIATDEIIALVRKVSKVLNEEKAIDLFTALENDTNPYQGLTNEEFERFQELVPFDTLSGMPPHSIKSITLIEELECIY